MRLKQYQVDAFTNSVFGGNPAAIVPLTSWLDDATLQAIAEENNLSETAFFVPTDVGFQLRWFTPLREIDLCGHATLATAYIIFNRMGYDKPQISFESRSGELLVEKQGDRLVMDFPATPPKSVEISDALVKALGVRPLEVWMADDYLAVYDSETTIRSISPDFGLMAQLDLRGVGVTAPGTDVDFVSRFFAPKFGVFEDPVTGSAHCELAPFWAKRLNKSLLTARQVSKRSGEMSCQMQGDRVLLAGQAVIFMEADINF